MRMAGGKMSSVCVTVDDVFYNKKAPRRVHGQAMHSKPGL